MIRPPKSFADALGILEVLKWAHENSVYSALTFDEMESNRLICQAIQRHGFKNRSASFVHVSEVEGKIEGFIIGVLNPIYHCHREIGASDLYWIATKRCPARDKVGLMLAMVDWAKAHPHVVEITSATSGAMGGAEGAAKILGKLGFEPFGSIYRMEVQRA